jgi:RNA polymerase sigma-70 factor (ECF subfamily)
MTFRFIGARERTRRMARDEPRNFEKLEEEYGGLVFRFCYRLCGHREDAEDLAQEVMLLLWRNLDRFEGRSSLPTWIYRIALNRRRRQRRPAVGSVDLEEAKDALAKDSTESRLVRLTLDQALGNLSETLREAFLLVKAEGLKYREAAEVLGVPVGTVQSRVHEATTRLRSMLKDELDRGEGAEEKSGSPCAKGGAR